MTKCTSKAQKRTSLPSECVILQLRNMVVTFSKHSIFLDVTVSNKDLKNFDLSSNGSFLQLHTQLQRADCKDRWAYNVKRLSSKTYEIIYFRN